MRAGTIDHQLTPGDPEARDRHGLQPRLALERQRLVDAPGLQRKHVLRANPVPAVRDVGEGEVEPTRFALVRAVEVQRDEHVRPDLRGLRQRLRRPDFARRHHEVWRDAFDAVGQNHRVLVVGEGGR